MLTYATPGAIEQPDGEFKGEDSSKGRVGGNSPGMRVQKY